MDRQIKAELTNMCMVYEGSRVLVQKRRPEHGWPGVTFPGGHVEPGESITQSVMVPAISSFYINAINFPGN